MKGEQFEPDFLKISPNNKIPVLYDSENDFYLFESVAILQYLAENHKQFLPVELKDKYIVLEWCFFQAAHIGPMFGQYGHFNKFAKEDVPYAKERYTKESERLMNVLENQLKEHDYISGNHYTIADMAIWPWVHGFQTFYQGSIQSYPKLINWYKTLEKRPAIKNALAKY